MYYPFLEIENFENFTSVFNFPPNNWELKKKFITDKYLNLSWIENNQWKTKNVTLLKKNQKFELNNKEIKNITTTKNFKLISLTDNLIDQNFNKLPVVSDKSLTKNPSWRASVGLKFGNSKTSYQGEIYPFPEKGNTLSICPFLKFSKKSIKNYLIFLNLEKNPYFRKCKLNIYESYKQKLIKSEIVYSNKINIISLNDLHFDYENSFLIVKTDNIIGVPLYVSYSSFDDSLSIEHTHPPGSFSLLGQRNKIQNLIKKNFENL